MTNNSTSCFLTSQLTLRFYTLLCLEVILLTQLGNWIIFEGH